MGSKFFSGGSGIAGAVQGFNQGREDEADIEKKNLLNQQEQMKTQQGAQQQQGQNLNYQGWIDKAYGANSPESAAATKVNQNPVMDPFMSKLSAGIGNIWSGAKKAITAPFHSNGPAAQQTTQAPSNQAASRPGPTSSGSGDLGKTGPTLDSDSLGVNPLGQLSGPAPNGQGPQLANGGIPGRKTRGIRPRPGSMGGKGVPPEMPSPGKLAGASGNDENQGISPSRNTEASPSDQDPMLADGKWVQKAIKHPGALHKDLGVPEGETIPKGKLKAAEEKGGKVGKRAQLAETMSHFSHANGGKIGIPPTALSMPKPQPNAVRQEVTQMGDRNRFSRMLKREDSSSVPGKYDDGGGAGQPNDQGPDPEQMARVRAMTNPVGEQVSQAVTGVGNAAREYGPESTADRMRERLNENNASQAAPPAAAAPPPDVPHGQEHPELNQDMGGPPAFGIKHPGPWDGGNEQQPLEIHGGQGPAGGKPAGGGGGMQGPPKPQGVNLEQLVESHEQVPQVSANEWDGVRRAATAKLASMGVTNAGEIADQQISDHQHQQFLQYMERAQALEGAGDMRGAMVNIRAAYQYAPSGHDIHLAIDPQSKSIVGFGVDENTGKRIGGVPLDTQGLANVMTRFANPESFYANNVTMREQQLKENQFNAVGIPLSKSEEAKNYEYAHALSERPEAQVLSAEIRAEASMRRLSQTNPAASTLFSKMLADPAKSGIQEQERGESLVIATEIQARNPGQDPQKTLGQVMNLYALAKDNPALIDKAKHDFGFGQATQPSGGSPVAQRSQNPYAMGAGYPGSIAGYGYGLR